MQKALVRRLLPKAALTVYLDVAADVAAERKVGDSFGEPAIRRQLERYRALLGSAPDVHCLEATGRPEALAHQMFQSIVELGER